MAERKRGNRMSRISFVYLLYNGDVYLVIIWWCLNGAKEREKGGRGRKKGEAGWVEVVDEGEEERRCGEIDPLASQQFNTTELLLHSSPYEMRSLFLSGSSRSVCSCMCDCTCVYLHVCISIQYVGSTYDWINTLPSGFKSPPFCLCLFYVCLSFFFSFVSPSFPFDLF